MIDWIAETAHDLDGLIRPTVVETPLVARDVAGRSVLCKQENLQTTGSFKIRGAMAKLLALSPAERQQGVLTASTGNHGAAVARAGSELGVGVTVFVPSTVDATKLKGMTEAGAGIIRIPGDPVAAEVAARQTAVSEGLHFVSPYNDKRVVAGQGTLAVELLRQAAQPGRVIISVGGGGLIAGAGAVLKAAWPSVDLVAASPENSSPMHDSVAVGHLLDQPTRATLSDGTAGGVEPGSITFDLCRGLVDGWIKVSEVEIATEMVAYLDRYDDRIEGAAAVALAATRKLDDDLATVVVLCGGNAGDDKLDQARALAAG